MSPRSVGNPRFVRGTVAPPVARYLVPSTCAAVVGSLTAGALIEAAAASRPTTVTRHHYPNGYTETVYDGGPKLGWRGSLVVFSIICAIVAISLIIFSPLFLILLAVPVVIGGVALTVHLVDKNKKEKSTEEGKQTQPSIQEQNQRKPFTGAGQATGYKQNPDQNGNVQPDTNNNGVQADPAMQNQPIMQNTQ